MKKTAIENDPASKKLGEVITEKAGVLTTRHTAEQAADKMRALDTDVLPVSENRRLVGTMTGKHLDRKAAGYGHDPKIVRVGEEMSRQICYCFENQDRSEADLLMKEKNLRYLPVVDSDMRIVGMITRADVQDSESDPVSAAKPLPTHRSPL